MANASSSAAAAPLAGKRIVVTRAAHQAGKLVDLLQQEGAEAIPLPTIEIAAPENWQVLDLATDQLDSYDGVIFTSVNGVEHFFTRAAQRGRSLHKRAGQWLCAIGPATAAALAERGWQADVIPERYVAESLVEALSAYPLSGQRILIPRAAVARDVIPAQLAARGAVVLVVEAYRTVPPANAAELTERYFPRRPAALDFPRLPAALDIPQPPAALAPPDAVLFTSSSTVRHFTTFLGPEYRERLANVPLAAIGPVTAATLRELGLPVAVEADEYTIPGLVAALKRFFAKPVQ